MENGIGVDVQENEAPEDEDIPTLIKNEVGIPRTSKNQLKRQRRYEKLMQVKHRRKLQEKEGKLEKAKVQGRDLDEERREMEERTRSGEGKKRRQELWEQKKLPLALKSFKVCIDCSFESKMTSKEINSLASQIRYCYSNNKNNEHPCLLAATSVVGETLKHLKNVSGFEEWSRRAFTVTDESLEEYYKENLDKVVYLTSDATTTLTDLDDSKIYVIGGIVDRNRLKRVAIERADALGLKTAKLPLDDYVKKMVRVIRPNFIT